jgi:hypothetical protein
LKAKLSQANLPAKFIPILQHILFKRWIPLNHILQIHRKISATIELELFMTHKKLAEILAIVFVDAILEAVLEFEGLLGHQNDLQKLTFSREIFSYDARSIRVGKVQHKNTISMDANLTSCLSHDPLNPNITPQKKIKF